jgi:hypothetical protein
MSSPFRYCFDLIRIVVATGLVCEIVGGRARAGACQVRSTRGRHRRVVFAALQGDLPLPVVASLGVQVCASTEHAG